MSTDLLDAAYERAESAYTDEAHANAVKRLERRFPNADPNTIAEAYALARRLKSTAEELADRTWRGELREGHARKALQDRCPGFSDETYRSAFARGLHNTK